MLVKKKFVKKKFGQKSSFWSKKVLVKKKFDQKNLSRKTFFSPKMFEVRKVYCQNKLVRVLNRCQLSLTNFCPTEMAKVNPGGGLVNPPTPVSSRVKIVLGCC